MRLITLYNRVELISDDWNLDCAVENAAIGVVYSCPIGNPQIVYALYPEVELDLDDVIEGDIVPCCDRMKRVGLSKMTLQPYQSKTGGIEFGYMARSYPCNCHARWMPWEWQKHGEVVITGGKRIR